MKDGFTRKKVESLTLGEKLRKLRGDFRMNLTEISRVTRVQVKYLEFLENGEYEKLPADVYVRGFLRSYARYLNIDEQALVKLYERERNIQKNLGQEEMKKEVKPFTPTAVVITSRSLIVGGIILLVGGAFFYLYQEFKSFAADPKLIILEPQNGAVVENEEVVVRGKTDKGAQVSLNDQEVFVDNEGLFSSKLFFEPGINTLRVRTVNRFDKEKSVTLSIEARYTPAVPLLPGTEVVHETFPLVITARTLPLTVTVIVDGAQVFTGKLALGERKQFEAKERVVITSDHGEATLVQSGESEALLLSDKPGPVAEAVFLKSGREE